MNLQNLLTTDSPNDGRQKINQNNEEIPKGIDAVAGGGGFVNVSGTVEMNLNEGRAFLHTMIGNIDTLNIANIPSGNERMVVWTWVLAVDSTGGYTISGTPAVEWIDGAGFDQLDLSANAINIMTFFQIGSTTYGVLNYTGTIALDAYKFTFLDNEEQVVYIDQDEDIDIASAGDNTGSSGGTITYKKNGSSISQKTSFSAGDTLEVEVAGQSSTTAISVPRFLT